MNNQSNAGVVIMQVTQPVVPGTEFNEESFPVAQAFSPAAVKEVENFYVATQKGGDVVGVISDTENNRNIVAALVGNWVSAGYVITQLNRKDLLKKLRPAPVVAAKQEASTAEQVSEVQEVAQPKVQETAPAAQPQQVNVASQAPVVEQPKPEPQAPVQVQAPVANQVEEDMPEF